MKKPLIVVALLIFGAPVAARAQGARAVDVPRIIGQATRCIQGMTLPNAIIAAQAAPSPRVLPTGSEVLTGTISSPVVQVAPQNGHVSEIGHRVRLRLRMSSVKPAEIHKFIDFTAICRGWTEQNIDYVEECSLDPGSKPADSRSYVTPLKEYQTRITLRDGKVDGCKPGISLQIDYAVAIQPAFLDQVGGPWLLILTQEELNTQMRTAITGLFDYWVSGFKP